MYQCPLQPVQLLRSVNLTIVYLHDFIHSRNLWISLIVMICLTSCGKLFCFHSVHLKKFQTVDTPRKSRKPMEDWISKREATQTKYLITPIMWLPSGKNFAGTKEESQGNHTTNPGFLYRWLPSMKSSPLCRFICSFIQWKLNGYLLCFSHTELKKFK